MRKILTFSSILLAVGAIDAFPASGRAPQGKPPQPVDVPGDHYQCYTVVRAEPLKPEKIIVADQFGKAVIVLARPMLLCNPAVKVHRDKKYEPKAPDVHLVCYMPVRSEEKPRLRRVEIGNQFQVTNLVVSDRSLFCVPSRKKLLG